MTSSPAPPSAADLRRPRSNQTVSVTYDEDSSVHGPDSSRLHFEVSECIETKTVTTTTTTKRTFPPVHVRESRPLVHLDGKEYPLANKPLPPELASFSYSIPHPALSPRPAATRPPTSKMQIEGIPIRTENHESLAIPKDAESSQESSSQDMPHSPSDGYPRKSQLANTRASSSDQKTSTRLPKLSREDKMVGLPHSDAIARRLRRGTARSASQRDGDRNARLAGCLATPDTSELMSGSTDRQRRPRPLHLDTSACTPETSSAHTTQPLEGTSPVTSETHTVFSSNVATPPITDADAEPFGADHEPAHRSMRAVSQRPSLDTVAAQDATLPSPRLSPTLAAASAPLGQSQDADDDGPTLDAIAQAIRQRPWCIESQASDEQDQALMLSAAAQGGQAPLGHLDPHSTMLDVRSMMETFDAMPNEMKSFIMYNFLRRCPRKTLRLVADAVTPALKCDFLKQLPLELSFNVLSYLDHRDLCRAAQVSKQWRNIIDTNETGWKELFDRDGFTLPPGELEKAITQGWGWQDPAGSLGAEVDLSRIKRLNAQDGVAIRAIKPDPTAKLRSAKRKRGLNIGGTDRSKRRASAQEAALADASAQQEVKQHKSEGPLSAANAAATAVPNPEMGLPSLQKLHLFKSLYRRHHSIRQSWTNGKVKPGHVAFAAHPRHVITSLQFDEDKIITGSDDTLIHVYDTKTGKLRKRLEGHEGGVWALQYEGNVLVSGSTDRSVRVWDIEKGLCTQVFYGHTSTVRCLQILMPAEIGKNPDGSPLMMPPNPLIITGSRDSQLRVWRLPEPGSRRYIQTGPPANDNDCPFFIRTLLGHTHSVRAISAHGDTLVSGSYDSTVRVWRISTGESLHVLHGHSQKVYSVVLDHERNRCISGSMDSLVKIWDLETGSCLYNLEGHSLLVGLLDLRDQRLVSAAADSTLRIWDPENGKCRNVLTAHTGAITCFQHDGRKVISGSETTVKMWDIKTGECVQDLLTDLNGVWQVKFDERRCVAAVRRGSLTYVEILDFGAVRDGKPPEELGKRKLLNESEVSTLLAEEA